MKSEYMKINLRDFRRGLILSAIATGIKSMIMVALILKAGSLPTAAEWITTLGGTMELFASTLLGYLGLNALTNSAGKIGKG